jgi:hypothetical protein
MSRKHRSTVAATALLVSALGAGAMLAACQTITNEINAAPAVSTAGLQALIQDVQLVDAGLQAAAAGLGAAAGLNSAQIASINAALAAVHAAAGSVGKSTDLTGAATVNSVKAFAVALNTVVGVTAGIPILPPEWKVGLEAASALLPIIEAAVGIVSSADADRPAIAPAQARLILTGIKARAAQ